MFPLTSDPTRAYFRHASHLHARLHVTLQPNVNFVFVSRPHRRPPNQARIGKQEVAPDEI